MKKRRGVEKTSSGDQSKVQGFCEQMNRRRSDTKESIKIPRSVQDIIPASRVFDDGIFQTGRTDYSKTYVFSDINYQSASPEEQAILLDQYTAFLGSFDSDLKVKITINNRTQTKKDFESRTLIKEKRDELAEYRQEYNRMLMEKAAECHSITPEKYITLSVNKKSVDEARAVFNRSEVGLSSQLKRLGSELWTINAEERLRILYDFYRPGQEEYYAFTMKDSRSKGHSFRDYICPDYCQLSDDYIKFGEKYVCALFLKDYASRIKDDIFDRLVGNKPGTMLTASFHTISTAESVRLIDRLQLGVETNIARTQRSQIQNMNFATDIPYEQRVQREELSKTMDQITQNDEKLSFATITMTVSADSLKELKNRVEEVKTAAAERSCQMGVLKFQQLEGVITTLPFGEQPITMNRTLTTGSLSGFVPFRVQEITHEKGVYYGVNKVSKNLIIANKRKLQNGNSFILGVSGSGKSFSAKMEIASLAMATDADIIVIDPENEYSTLIKALGGEVIEISPQSKNHINAMDMSRYYNEQSSGLLEKSQFLQSLCEQVMATHLLPMGFNSIIDRCTEAVYRKYQEGGYEGTPPTMVEFREELLKQGEEGAKIIALQLEIFTTGTLNTFAKETNVDTENRILCYNIMELGDQLRAVGMLVILDSILNRITTNRAKGRETFIIIDEIYLLFQYEYSARFLSKLWKRVRKYGAFCTGITQNVEDLLQSHTARTMLSNSEFIIMLNQAGPDLAELAKLLKLSATEMSHITNAQTGSGLMRIGSSIVPFENRVPTDTMLYRSMTTKPGDFK